MKPRKFRITNWNNYTGHIGTIPAENSIATVTEEDQLRIIDRQKLMGDFNFEEIFDEPEKETVDFVEHDVVQRSGDIREDITIDTPIKKPGRPRNYNRGRPKKL